jgi:hypothetical protein
MGACALFLCLVFCTLIIIPNIPLFLQAGFANFSKIRACGGGIANPHAHEVKRFTALQSEELRVVNL